MRCEELNVIALQRPPDGFFSFEICISASFNHRRDEKKTKKTKFIAFFFIFAKTLSKKCFRFRFWNAFNAFIDLKRKECRHIVAFVVLHIFNCHWTTFYEVNNTLADVVDAADVDDDVIQSRIMPYKRLNEM